jgi:hypothetical protein
MRWGKKRLLVRIGKHLNERVREVWSLKSKNEDEVSIQISPNNCYLSQHRLQDSWSC